MSQYPINYDDDATLPIVNNNITEIGDEAINALRDAVFQIEQEVGLGGSGTAGSIAARVGISINPNGTLKPSAITGLGLITLPITNIEIDANAGILESKLRLDYRTGDLYNYIRDLSTNVNTALNWQSVVGSKLAPHVAGSTYRHSLSHIDVNPNVSQYLTNRFRTYRDNSDAYDVINDLNNEFLAHQFADGTVVTSSYIQTNSGASFPANYSHPANGVFLDASRFAVIPGTTQDLQLFADYIDQSSIFLLGTRIQNLYSNGISRSSRSLSLTTNLYGTNIVPSTPAYTFLSSTPTDNISGGDDIIQFNPTSGNEFDSQFSAVSVGDIIRVNYGIVDGYVTLETEFLVKEKKYEAGSTYAIRIDGKNLYNSVGATASIYKSLFNNNKYGVLAVAASNHPQASSIPSLIIGNPRSAMTLGLGFNSDLLDSSHYNLYLALYPTGNPKDGVEVLPPIDVTDITGTGAGSGARGITPGKYSLDSVIEAINNAVRQPGYNYRFIAFSYNGELGIMLADPYHNTGFTILSGITDGSGNYDQTATNSTYPNNVVGLFATGTQTAADPLGFGPNAANIASPPFKTSYSDPLDAQLYTKVWLPLKRNNYYVNGAEKDTLAIYDNQSLDGYGDGYWLATITSRNAQPGNVNTTYRVLENLQSYGIKLFPGKTIVIQSAGSGSFIDYGRFIIESITVNCNPNNTYTDITVYDSVHAYGSSPVLTSSSGTFALYFNNDSVSFNEESATDYQNYSTFKRYFEVYVDQYGKTFTHERGRINVNGSVLSVNYVDLNSTTETSKINVVKISPKLRGYQIGAISKISIVVTADSTTGALSANLYSEDGYHSGPIAYGRIGETLRVYDETNIDYIEIYIDPDTSISCSSEIIDLQLLPTLALDEEIMLLATCQVYNNRVKYLKDDRQFGNTSEKDFTTSAINFISSTDKEIHANNVIRGFDLLSTLADPNPNGQQIYLTGGTALVNGQLIQKNAETVSIPIIKEKYLSNYYNINWALCVNSKAEYEIIPLLDYDAVLGTPALATRSFVAFNTAPTGNTYNLDSITFSQIINNRKDLTLLYVIASAVDELSYPSIVLTVNDCRRFSNNIENNLSLTYNTKYNQSEGNFTNIESIFNWIKYNGSFNGDVVLQSGGSTLTTNSKAYLGGTNSSVVIDGKNETTIIFNERVTFASNVTFKNINIRFSNYITFVNSSNIRFENCDILIAQTPIPSIIMDISNSTDIIFDNCDITHVDQYPPTTIFNLTDSSNFKFIDCSMSVATTVIAPDIPGYIFTFNDSTNITIKDSVFTGNFIGAVKLTGASNTVLVDNCSITSTYDPYYFANPNYSISNLVNHGYGYIQSTVASVLNSIRIQNTTFEYNPPVASNHRFSFINFDLSTNSSKLEGLEIVGCRFNDSSIPTADDAVRPAISIINTVTTISTQYVPQPTVIGTRISNNICNKNQSIILTSTTDIDGYMNLPALQAQNCIISNNVCGVIGYWVGSGTKYKNIAPSTNSLNDQGSNLIIDSNTCHYIAAMDSVGQYFSATRTLSGITTNMCSYTSGFVTIRNNNANWVHTSITYEDNTCLQIINNNLYSYDKDFLNQFAENSISPVSAINYAITVIANKYDSRYNYGNGSSCVISGNTTNIGRWMTADMLTTYTTEYYGGIFTRTSATITDNIIRGIDGYTDGEFHMISLGGKVNICTHNQLYRTTNSVASYIGFYNGETPEWYGLLGSSGIITENYLDSPYTDAALTNDIVFDLPFTLAWTVERNINQTVTRMLSFADGKHSWHDPNTAMYQLNTMPAGVVAAQTAANIDLNEVIVLYSGASAPNSINYSMRLDLSSLIPIDTYLTSLSVTATSDGPIITPDLYTGQLEARTYIYGLTPPQRTLSTAAHSFNSLGETYTFNLQGLTLYPYNNKQSHDEGFLYAEFLLRITDNSSTIDTKTTFSGLLVKYRW